MFDEIAFRQFVDKKGVKLKSVAAAMGMQPSTLYRKMKGQLDFSRSEIQKCCDFFGVKEMYNIFFADEVS